MNIVFLDSDTLYKSIHLKQPDFEHNWAVFNQTKPDEVLPRIADADIVITNKVVLNREIIEKTNRLKMIAVAATGYNNVDLHCCREKNITVSNVQGYANHAVPEHTFSLILALQRKLLNYAADVSAGRWQKSEQFCFLDHTISDLYGKTLGIIGGGDLGLSVARLAECFGMKVNIVSRTVKDDARYTDFDSMIETADIITLHCPLNEQTKNMLNKNVYQKMKKKPLIINTARGGIANEEDTVWALQNNCISGIGFDCLSQEPPVDGNPLLSISHLPNVIITPHVAWASTEAMQNLWYQVIDNIEGFYYQKPQNVIQ